MDVETFQQAMSNAWGDSARLVKQLFSLTLGIILAVGIIWFFW